MAVIDAGTQGYLYADWVRKGAEITLKLENIKTQSTEIVRAVSAYKKLLEDIACESSNLMSLVGRLESYGITSCLFKGDIRILNFNLETQIKIFDLIGDVAKLIAKGILENNTQDGIVKTEEKLRASIIEYQQKRKEAKQLEFRLLNIERQYLSYDREVELFEKYYDKTFID